MFDWYVKILVCIVGMGFFMELNLFIYFVIYLLFMIVIFSFSCFEWWKGRRGCKDLVW